MNTLVRGKEGGLEREGEDKFSFDPFGCPELILLCAAKMKKNKCEKNGKGRPVNSGGRVKYGSGVYGFG